MRFFVIWERWDYVSCGKKKEDMYRKAKDFERRKI